MNKIAIHSVPRSGSTWLGSIFDAHPEVIYKYQPLFSYALKGYLNESSSAKDIDSFYSILRDTKDDFIDQTIAKSKNIVPEFYKVNNPQSIVYKEVRYHHILPNLLAQGEDVKVIGLIRNPLAVIYSWWKAPKEFRADYGWEFNEEWLYAPSKNQDKVEEFNGYAKWKEVAYMFESLKNEYPNRFYLLEYDDLLMDTRQAVSSLFDFCNISLHPQVEGFLLSSRSEHKEDAYGVFKKRTLDKDWMGNIPKEMEAYIRKDLTNTILEKYL